MSFFPVYLLHRFFSRLALFFRHWYLGGSAALFRAAHRTLSVLAIRFFAPRRRAPKFFMRVFFGGAVALIATPLFLFLYAAWLALPLLTLAPLLASFVALFAYA